MQINQAHLRDAVSKGVLDAQQADALWAFLTEHNQEIPSFRATHILYYLGGLIAIGAMSLFMTLGWEGFGGAGIATISIAYAILGLWLTEYLLKQKHLAIPAGITAAFVVTLVPLAIYGVQEALGFWADGMVYREYHTHIDWRWMLMELGTLAAGALLLMRYKLPFLLMPVAVTLWYMSMDLTPFLFGDEDTFWDYRKWVSMAFGLFMLLAAFWVDLRTRNEHHKDYGFWLYLFGTLAFWGGLTAMSSDSELGKFAYLCINLVMIMKGAVLSRRVLAVFGGFGVAGYLGHLAYDVFKDSVLFPFALTAVGLGIIYLGILWQRHEQQISMRLRGLLPKEVREMVEGRG